MQSPYLWNAEISSGTPTILQKMKYIKTPSESENEPERTLSRCVQELLANIRTQRRRKHVFLDLEAERQNAIETLLSPQRDLAASFSSLATTQNAIAQTLLPVSKKLNVNKCRIAKKRHADSEDALEIMQKKSCLENEFVTHQRNRTYFDFYNERMAKRPNNDDSISPSPYNVVRGGYSLDNDPSIDVNKDVEDNFIVDDVGDLYFDSKEQPHDYKIGNINVSQLFRQWQNESVKISKNGGLLVESNIHEILSLSSIILLVPGSHSKTMINIFGSQLLDKIHQQTVPPRNVTLNSECESKFRAAIKKAKQSRDSAMDWFHQELINNLSLKKNLGLMVLRGLETLPNEKVRNEPSEATLIT
ncbi:2203_t:CDS:2 [Paraglomus occultum]|uniref:2203_t:CDS:1 n=1 Tax=Paraglomus occultum TaxID=144539 RepID=A0A9N9B1M5_9GLOM|nr:2203_t:CDS:2 [Paraglomus occultum]